MERRPLGRTGLEVSPIGLGCVTFGREIDARTAFVVLDQAREKGINLLDTAAAYHAGASESVLGDWLMDRGCRDECVIATKVAVPLNRTRILASAEESLRRLRVDAIDLFQLHAWDAETPLEETLEALESLRAAGKIRHAGCSNWSAEQLRDASHLMETIQPPYNLVQRGIEKDLLPYCSGAGIGVLSYSPLAAGFLTGKYREGGEIPAGTRFEVIPGHQPIYFTPQGWSVLEGLRSVAARLGQPMADLALRWVMSRPGITSVLIGARETGHVDQALRAAERVQVDAWIGELSALGQPV